MTETWRMVTSFILVIIAFDLALGLPFVYGEKGLLGQTLAANTEFSDDVFIGVWQEKALYGCTSWANGPYSDLPACSESQTKNIYIIVSIIIPILALALVFTLLNPKVFIGLLRDGI